MIKKICFALAICVLGSCSPQNHEEESLLADKKIITAGGTVSEVIAALGFEANIIATDITSTFPESLKSLPSIGYRNQIKAEGILSLGPDLILAEEGYLNADVVQQLRDAGIAVKFFKKPIRIAETYSLIDSVSSFLDVQESGVVLKNKLKAEEEALKDYLSSHPVDEIPDVAFIMARGIETVFVAGEETFAANIISMAGGNPVGKGFKDFIPLTPESLVSMDPDYLVFFTSGIATLGGESGVSQIKGIDQTTAFQKKQVLDFDGQYLSGFGPRVAQAALELAKAIRND
jgi:iron complex transport system substrate-binding protein